MEKKREVVLVVNLQKNSFVSDLGFFGEQRKY